MSVMYSTSVLNYSDAELRRNPEMDSIHHLNSGLMRYSSAPSSFLASLVQNSHGCVNEEASRRIDHRHHQNPSSSSEMEAMLAKLVSSSSNNGWIKQEETGESVSEGGHSGYNSNYGSQMIYQPQTQQQQAVQGLPNGSLGSSGNAFDGSFNSTESKIRPNNLFRQKSSPAGLFNNFSVENGFATWRDVGSFRACDHVSNGQASTSASGLNENNTLAFSSRPSSCSRQLPDIAEDGNETLEEEEEETCVDKKRNLRNDNNNGNNTECYIPSFTSDFWDGPSFSDTKTTSDNDELMFTTTSNGFETQNADFGYQNVGLTHHLSLPSSSTKSKMSAIEKFLQVQGSVPCKIRAKRGFATHPRSIAERERRTRISERIKKLQDLFPKSEKQTSTADMLDLAVHYIKDLQKQVKMLTDTKAKCKCSSQT